MSADHSDYDYGVPSPDDLVVLPFDAGARARARGGNPPTDDLGAYDSWTPIDLNDPQWDEPARAPDLHELLYSGLRHLFSGPPETTKTLLLYDACLRLTRAGKRVAIIDFEMGPRRAKLLLRELGATPDDLARILFVAPETPPTDALEAVIAWNPVLVVIDAALGAFQATGLDDNNRGDVETYAATWIAPLWRAGIATAAIDHVTKNVETRAGFAIGSERKGGFVDVHIGLSVSDKRPLTRGGRATVQAEVHKDRPGFLRRPGACYFVDIVSHEDTHQLELSYRQPEAMPHTPTGGMRPTIKMEQISRWVAQQPSPPSKNAVIEGVGGNKPAAATAIEILIAEAYLEELSGPRQAKLLHTLKPYAQDTDPALRTPSETPLPPTSPTTSPGGMSEAGVDRLPPTSPSPLKGAGKDGGSRDTPLRPPLSATSPNPDQDELQRLLDKYESELGGNE